MKKTALFSIFVLLLSLLLPSCGEKVECGGEYYTFKDSLGYTVALDKKPERVAVLFSSFADVWLTAGGKVDITVGETVERGFADKDAVLVDATSGHTSINTERLIAERPDLVIVTADHGAQRECAELMRSVGIPAAALRIESFSDYLGVLRVFTDILGTQERYVTYGEAVAREINDIVSETRVDKDSMLFIRSGTSERSVKAKRSEDHFAAAMAEELGFTNIADRASELIDGLSLEVILKEDPSYIFVTFMGDETDAMAYMDSLLMSEGWSSLTAVKEGRVIYLPKELFHFKPNARWAEAYGYIAKKIARCEK